MTQSIPPASSMKLCAASLQSSGFWTSNLYMNGEPPSFLHRIKIPFNRSTLLADNPTIHLRFEYAYASASPMPDDAPVINIFIISEKYHPL